MLKTIQVLSGKLKTEVMFKVEAIFQGVFMGTETPK